MNNPTPTKEANMALKDEAIGVADELRDLPELLRRHLERLETRVRDIAGLIPTPEEAAAHMAVQVAEHGDKIGRRDLNGKPLRVGDRVQVYGSDRFGQPQGKVIGPGPIGDDGKERVALLLDDWREGLYTPSTGRVERIERARKGDPEAEGDDGDGNGHTSSVIVIGLAVPPEMRERFRPVAPRR